MPLILDGDLQLVNEFDGDICLTILEEGEGGVFMEVSSQQYDTYTGDYIVIPTTAEQVLSTQDKIMLDDVTITKVPYYETSNPSGGKTVYIASEIGG